MNVSSTQVELSVENIAVSFGGLVAISDLSFSVSSGEIVSLIGPNGAGKTTAFNIITGFIKPTAGSISYRGDLVHGLPTHKVAELGIIRTFQKTNLFQKCDVFDNVMIGLYRRGKARLWEVLLALPRVAVEERALRDEAQEIIDFVGLHGREDVLAGALSYGEQRLLEVAIALAARPSLLLLDEPVSGMNPTETDEFVRLVQKIRDRQISVLLVEHDMRMVMKVSDRIVVLNHGRIIASGSPLDIRNDPEVVRAYLGRRRQYA